MFMYRQTFFLVPSPASPADVITEICLSLAPLAAARDIQFSYVGSESRASGATLHKIVDVMDNLAQVDLLVDSSLPSWYLVVTAALDDVGTGIVDGLKARVPMLTTAQLQEQAAAGGRTPGALIALGMGLNGTTSPEAEQLLRDGLTSPDMDTRYAAAVGASFLRSQELANALDRAAEAEPDEDITRVMIAAREICSRVG